jgi:hypothetical protein
MGQSTNGQICYGILFNEDTEFPWDKETNRWPDIEEWWVFDVLDFRHSFEIFTPEGDWIGGKEWPKEKINQYYEERESFEEQNPELPVVLVNYCSSEYPIYILAIPETYFEANRGYPKEFSPPNLTITDDQKDILINFCNDHDIEFDDEPGWYLSSYWGM